MKKYFVIAAALFLAIQANCQFGEIQARGAKSLAMAGSDVLFHGVDAFNSNQAGIAFAEEVQALASVQQLFSLSELGTVSISGLIPVEKLGVFGIGLTSLGFEQFQETSIGLGYGRKLGENLAIGAKFNIFNSKIIDYGSTFLPSVDLGLQTALMKNVDLGFHVSSPIRTAVTTTQDLATQLTLGVGYHPTTKLDVILESSKYIDGDINVSGGIHYAIVPAMSIRFGAATNPGTVSGGLSLNLRQKYSIEGGFSYHEVLGLTPCISIRYANIKAKSE